MSSSSAPPSSPPPPPSSAAIDAILSSVSAFQKDVLSKSTQVSKATVPLTPETVTLHRSENPAFASALGSASLQLQSLSNSLLKLLTPTDAHNSAPIRPFTNALDVQDRWSSIVDVLDVALDKADRALDEFYGRTPAESSMSGGSGVAAAVRAEIPSGPNGSSLRVLHASNLVRPQQLFSGDIDNSTTVPFVPKLKEKPNAVVPWTPVTADDTQGLPVDHVFPHPYAHEIENLDYPASMFESPPEHVPKPNPIETTPYDWIDTVPALDEMISVLVNEPVIAVDLEHHSYRSYLGLTCLMQISSAAQDWVVDTLALRLELRRLNLVFTNPSIVKVLHGADSDVIWLQRDLGVYLVNLFDTYHATKVLGFPSHGYAYLLKHYCHVETDKRFQLADWRLRPLPAEMLKYARMDTRYLIYIYDRLRSELLATGPGPMYAVLRASAQVALKVFAKERYDAVTGEGSYGWRNMWEKYRKAVTQRTFAVFKALHEWRDTIARDEDESPAYVLPNHMLFAMIDTLPIDIASVLACCTPVPPLVRLYAGDIARMIKDVADAVPAVAVQAMVPVMPQPTHIRFGESDGEGQEESVVEEYVRKNTPVVVQLSTGSSFWGAEKVLKSEHRAAVVNRVRMILDGMSSVEALLPKLFDPESMQVDQESDKAPHEPPGTHIYTPASDRMQSDPATGGIAKDAVIVINKRAAAVPIPTGEEGEDDQVVTSTNRKRKLDEVSATYDFTRMAPVAAPKLTSGEAVEDSDDDGDQGDKPAVDKEEKADGGRKNKRSRTGKKKDEHLWNPYLEAPVSQIDGSSGTAKRGGRGGGRGGRGGTANAGSSSSSGRGGGGGRGGRGARGGGRGRGRGAN